MNKYWLHRISHCSDESYPLLLDNEILTIGWQYYVGKKMIDALKAKEKSEFEKLNKEHGFENRRSRHNLWRFSRMTKGDIIVVPMYNKKFGVFEVVDNVKEITSLEIKEFKNNNGDKIVLDKEKKGLVNTKSNTLIDLGYFLKVKTINITYRKNADSKLVSKMKTLLTNCSLDDVKEFVEYAKTANEPFDPYDRFLSDLVNKSITNNESNIFSVFTPDQFQDLIKLYFERIGATRVESLIGKQKSVINPGLEEKYGDVDVVAQFEDLNLVFNVQVKRHDGKTGTWGIQQIKEYSVKLSKENSEDALDETIHIPWVISSAEFSDEAVIEAEQANIRLIGGKELLRMLLRAGFVNMDVSF